MKIIPFVVMLMFSPLTFAQLDSNEAKATVEAAFLEYRKAVSDRDQELSIYFARTFTDRLLTSITKIEVDKLFGPAASAVRGKLRFASKICTVHSFDTNVADDGGWELDIYFTSREGNQAFYKLGYVDELSRIRIKSIKYLVNFPSPISTSQKVAEFCDARYTGHPPEKEGYIGHPPENKSNSLG